jgi:hypothetical protein
MWDPRSGFSSQPGGSFSAPATLPPSQRRLYASQGSGLLNLPHHTSISRPCTFTHTTTSRARATRPPAIELFLLPFTPVEAGFCPPCMSAAHRPADICLHSPAPASSRFTCEVIAPILGAQNRPTDHQNLPPRLVNPPALRDVQAPLKRRYPGAVRAAAARLNSLPIAHGIHHCMIPGSQHTQFFCAVANLHPAPSLAPPCRRGAAARIWKRWVGGWTRLNTSA